MQVIITSKFEEQTKTFIYDDVMSVKVADDKAILGISKGVTATVNYISEILIRR